MEASRLVDLSPVGVRAAALVHVGRINKSGYSTKRKFNFLGYSTFWGRFAALWGHFGVLWFHFEFTLLQVGRSWRQVGPKEGPLTAEKRKC